MSKNIVVLVDSSMSVEDENRKSALELVAGLVTGKVSDACRDGRWVFKPEQSIDHPTVLNLDHLMKPDPGTVFPIARKSARFVISPLGNYARVGTLRAHLGDQKTGSPGEIAEQLTHPPEPFTSVDKSTHISLAEAVVAEAFLKSASEMPYYLIVISDFNEDCHNSAPSVYQDKKANADLQARNAEVFDRKKQASYDDGGTAKGKYSPEDFDALDFRKGKIRNLLIGEFRYVVPVKGKLPVNVKIYSPMMKRELQFAAAQRQWVLPDKAPDLPVSTEGLDIKAPLEVQITHPGDKSEKRITETCSLILPKNRLVLGKLMDRSEFEPFPAPGQYQIILSAAQTIGPPVVAKATLEIVAPVISVENPKLNASTREDPFEFPPKTEILNERISFKLVPAPGEDHDLDIKCGEKEATVTVEGGSGELDLKDFLEELMNQPSADDLIQIHASLSLKPTADNAVKDVWLKRPGKVHIWAVQPGEALSSGSDPQASPDKPILITLTKNMALAFKSNLAGTTGMNWSLPAIKDSDGKPVTDQRVIVDNNNLNFSGLPAGNYTVEAKFGSRDKSGAQKFEVTVPGRTPWMLIAIGAMVAISLALFSWHFFRR